MRTHMCDARRECKNTSGLQLLCWVLAVVLVIAMNLSLSDRALALSTDIVLSESFQKPGEQIGFCRKCKRCDDAALEKAKKEFEQALAEAKEDEAKSDARRKDLDALYKQGEDAFDEAVEPVTAWKGAHIPGTLTLHKIAEKVLEHELGGLLENEAAAKAVAEVLGETMTALELAEITTAMSRSIVTDLGILSRSRAIAAQGAQAADAAVASLKRANEAYARLKALQKDCASKASPPKGSASRNKSDKDNFESSGQKDAEAAEKLLQSWKKVEGGYEDANGDFYDANLAFQQALQIVQSHQSWLARPERRFVPVAFRSSSQQGQGTLSAAEYKNFIAAWANAFMHIADGYKKYQQIGVDIQGLKELPE